MTKQNNFLKNNIKHRETNEVKESKKRKKRRKANDQSKQNGRENEQKIGSLNRR